MNLSSSYAKNVFWVALATMSWGTIHYGSEAVCMLVFGVPQSELPVFVPAYIRQLYALIIIACITLYLFRRQPLALIKLMQLRNGYNQNMTVQQLKYGMIWGISIGMFVCSFQFVNQDASEFVFLLGLAGFAIYGISMDRVPGERLSSVKIARIAFNLFVLAFYLFSLKSWDEVAIEGEHWVLVGLIVGFIVSYHYSFQYKAKQVASDPVFQCILRQDFPLEGLKINAVHINVYKTLTQFLGATIVSLLIVVTLNDSLNTVIEPTHLMPFGLADLESVSDVLYLAVLASVYILGGTVGSYFLLNAALDGLNQANRESPREYLDGGAVAAITAVLEPIFACLLSIFLPLTLSAPYNPVIGMTEKWYVMVAILFLGLYVYYQLAYQREIQNRRYAA